jgi:ADP-heptose:LPS heptosyltransferase
MTFASGARERFGFREAREWAWIHYTHRISVPPDLKHAVDRVNHLAREVIRQSRYLEEKRIESTFPSEDFRIPVPPGARQSLPDLLGGHREKLVALCPATRWRSKQWPPENWTALLSRLHKKRPDLGFILLGATGDKGDFDEIMTSADAPARNLAGEADLWQTAAALEASLLAVTVDSAPLHLAAAVGTPTVSLFGPTDPERVAPRGDRHRVIQNTALDCPGCYKRTCPLPRRACLRDLSVDRVLEEVEGRVAS